MKLPCTSLCESRLEAVIIAFNFCAFHLRMGWGKVEHLTFVSIARFFFCLLIIFTRCSHCCSILLHPSTSAQCHVSRRSLRWVYSCRVLPNPTQSHFFTLDADMKPWIGEPWKRMLHFTVAFFIRNGIRGSVLILKVNAAETILKVIGHLEPCCKYCQVARCASAPLIGEFYIAAQLEQPDPSFPYQVGPRWPPAVEVTRIYRFAHVRYNLAIKDE